MFNRGQKMFTSMVALNRWSVLGYLKIKPPKSPHDVKKMEQNPLLCLFGPYKMHKTGAGL